MIWLGVFGDSMDSPAIAADSFRRGCCSHHTLPASCTSVLAGYACVQRDHVEQVLEPAIQLADEGFPVSPIAAKLWAGGIKHIQRAGGPGAHAFMTKEGGAPQYGQIQRNPDLATTFKTLAEHGAVEGGTPCTSFCHDYRIFTAKVGGVAGCLDL